MANQALTDTDSFTFTEALTPFARVDTDDFTFQDIGPSVPYPSTGLQSTDKFRFREREFLNFTPTPTTFAIFQNNRTYAIIRRAEEENIDVQRENFEDD